MSWVFTAGCIDITFFSCSVSTAAVNRGSASCCLGVTIRSTRPSLDIAQNARYLRGAGSSSLFVNFLFENQRAFLHFRHTNFMISLFIAGTYVAATAPRISKYAQLRVVAAEKSGGYQAMVCRYSEFVRAKKVIDTEQKVSVKRKRRYPAKIEMPTSTAYSF